jgi:AraC-like DNA-binding protein
MSNPTLKNRPRSREEWAKLGAYASPFSGTGIEFYPLSTKPADAEFVLHETGYDPKRPHWNYQRVYSPFWRLYYDLDRGHSVVLNDRETILGPDYLMLIPDHQLFHTYGTPPRSKFWLAFSHARRVVAGHQLPIQLRPSKTEKELIRDLTNLLWPVRAIVDRQRIYHLSVALLHIVLSRCEISWQAETPPGLQTVIRHVEQRYASALYVTDLARLANMSQTSFRKQFKAFRHVSPAQFIAQVRVREAGYLLSTTTLDLEQIAQLTGFPNAAYLSRVFHKLTGKTPGRARQESI